ncbi:hypothetical protein KAR91_53375 [Candidatus Pacearchaeota archaeon]|nr:hypothetical protein [Candidatus Pacearchaeota archaeon]
MNPNTAIRPWLRLCGSTWGNTQVHEYRWPDKGTKAQVEYFTYRQIGMEPNGERPVQLWDKKADNTTVIRKSSKLWIATYKINLYRSQNGMAELAKCITAAEDDNPTINKFFDDGGLQPFESGEFKNETVEVDDAPGLKENYHHSMIVKFYTNISISFEETNEVVQSVNITPGDWDK